MSTVPTVPTITVTGDRGKLHTYNANVRWLQSRRPQPQPECERKQLLPDDVRPHPPQQSAWSVGIRRQVEPLPPVPPPATGEPLRVIGVPFAARQEGIEAYCDYLARALGRRVQWAWAVVMHSGAALSGTLLRQHGEVILLSEDELQARLQFRDLAARFRPHLIHAHYAQGAAWAQLYGLPCVVTVHGLGGYHDEYFYGSNWANLSVRVSRACVPTDITITTGIEPVPFPRRRNLGEVVWCGRTDIGTGIHLFLQALQLVPKARAVIMGRACLQPFDLASAVRNLGLSDRVEVLGHLPPRQARRRLAQADALVVACQHSFGCALVEGMSAGVLPIVVDGPGYQAIVAAPWGYIARDETPEALAVALQEWLYDDDRYTRRRPMAAYVRRVYHLKHMARDYLTVFTTLALQHPKGLMYSDPGS